MPLLNVIISIATSALSLTLINLNSIDQLSTDNI